MSTTYGGRTWGIVVVKEGKIVAERYGMGFELHQAAQTHSAAKSFAVSSQASPPAKYGLDIDRRGALRRMARPGRSSRRDHRESSR